MYLSFTLSFLNGDQNSSIVVVSCSVYSCDSANIEFVICPSYPMIGPYRSHLNAHPLPLAGVMIDMQM